ncbi:MAG TPA: glycosyltransferase [Candidatus Nanoarchaeia archaeon]|nr:glycosyltransferase [Candidatus Nanoarchaeia archaeon]
MIDVIITSYNEPKSTLKAAQAFLKQAPKKDFRVTVVDPFPEVEKFLKKNIRDKRFLFYPDPGEGKSYALNLLMQEYASQNKDDILIFSDGDVYVSDNAVSEIINAFKDKEIGCVTGKPAPIDARNTKYGYWAHLFFAGIDNARKELSRNKKFFECSGYLFAIRKGVILDFPLETSEDSIIPYLFWKKGYKIKYLPEAEVYVKNPTTWKDWLAQKVRNIKAHENLNKIAPNMSRTKSFINEIRWGALFALRYPNNLREFFWTLEAFGARLILYIRAFFEIGKKKSYADGWRGQAKTESTKTLD